MRKLTTTQATALEVLIANRGEWVRGGNATSQDPPRVNSNTVDSLLAWCTTYESLNHWRTANGHLIRADYGTVPARFKIEV